MSETKNLFSTKDLTLAATLVSLGFKVEGITIQLEGSSYKAVGYFRFEEENNLQDTISCYMQGELKIEPRLLMSNIRTLKSSVVSAYKAP